MGSHRALIIPTMSTYPKSPKESTKGMMYLPRMLDKIRLHAKGELSEEYHPNLGRPKTADGACTNFLRVNYGVLTQRVLKGGTDEEILDWCYTNGRRLNEGDLTVWNAYVSKLGWNDFASPVLDEAKQKSEATHRTDLNTITEWIDFEEKRRD
jgi:gluconokinase